MFTESINYNKETNHYLSNSYPTVLLSARQNKTPTLTIVSIIEIYIVFRRTVDESIWCRGAYPCGMIMQFTLPAWETASFDENRAAFKIVAASLEARSYRYLALDIERTARLAARFVYFSQLSCCKFCIYTHPVNSKHFLYVLHTIFLTFQFYTLFKLQITCSN